MHRRSSCTQPPAPVMLVKNPAKSSIAAVAWVAPPREMTKTMAEERDEEERSKGHRRREDAQKKMISPK